MNFVLDNLAIGNYEVALNPPPIVSALLNVAIEKDLHDTTCLYHKIPIVDMQPIPSEQMQEAVEWIRDHSMAYRIMVFCNAGIGRSPSVVIGYLCCILGYGFGEAVEFVARRKPDISTLPNLIKTIEAVKAPDLGLD
ncbi:MAG: dual specificity protein phosphatase family protein [Deltaproteobacteria bacterium]|nr:dual specificity protein phosphatase family protein [Deltaproteobacteria bacterium]MBW2018570.1 dual specificity protein phosphatase family protein [Deltaproteobacteria bacterium]MBW2073306.1 dual specificity protein phosphatase family protein [Deltaproteobacteria bacterium]